MRFAPLAVILAWSLAQTAWAGWTQPSGDYYLKLWERSLVGSKVYLPSGDLESLPERFHNHSMNAYFEYGLLDDLTLSAGLELVGISIYGERSKAYSGPGWVGLRKRLVGGRVPFSVELRSGGRPPIGDDVLASGFAGGVPFVYRPAVSTLYADLLVKSGVALPFGFLAADFGTRVFSRSELHPALFGQLQFGVQFAFGLAAAIHGNAYASTGPLPVANVLGNGQTRYVGVGLGLSYWFTKRAAVTASVEGALLARANAGAAPISVGFEFR